MSQPITDTSVATNVVADAAETELITKLVPAIIVPTVICPIAAAPVAPTL